MAQLEISAPEEIARLPWAGNFADDAPLFAAIDRYLAREKNHARRAEAERLASKHGMGEE